MTFKLCDLKIIHLRKKIISEFQNLEFSFRVM